MPDGATISSGRVSSSRGRDQHRIHGLHSGSGVFSFSLTCLRVHRGKLTVTIQNQGRDLHNFTVSALHIDRDIQEGKSSTLHLRLTRSQPVVFLCTYHSRLRPAGSVPAHG